MAPTSTDRSGLVAGSVARVAAAALADLDPAATAAPADRSITRAQQAETLRRILEMGGPAAVLQAGQALQRLRPDPVTMVLLNSPSVEVLLDKVDRLNRFLHSHHRQEAEWEGEAAVLIRHVSLRGGAPAPIESLYVAGLVASLVEMIGARDVQVAFPDSATPGVVMTDGVIDGEVPLGGVDVWRILWTQFDSQRTLPGLDEILGGQIGPDLEQPPTTRTVVEMVSTDPARSWTISSAAGELAMSTRTLQRRLAAEGGSFTALLSSVRINAAKALLRLPELSVTEIAFRCGYSDAAHFSRSFRSAEGEPPSRWRRLQP